MFESKPYLTTSAIRNRLDICVGTNKITKDEAEKIMRLLDLDYEERKTPLDKEDGFIEDFKAMMEHYDAKIQINSLPVKWELLFDGFRYSYSESMYIEPIEMDYVRKRHKRAEYLQRIVPTLSKRMDIANLKPIMEAVYNVGGFRKVTDKRFKEMVKDFRRLNDELSQQ